MIELIKAWDASLDRWWAWAIARTWRRVILTVFCVLLIANNLEAIFVHVFLGEEPFAVLIEAFYVFLFYGVVRVIWRARGETDDDGA